MEVGVLATSVTVRTKLYENLLTNEGISVKNPDFSDQDKMGVIINNLVHSRQGSEDKEKLLQIAKHLTERDVNTILLACTDLQMITPKTPGVSIIDTMEILALSTVREILGPIDKNI